MYKRNIKILITFFLLAQVMLCPLPAWADAGTIPFIGEVRLFAFDSVPDGGVWVPADGRILQISEYDLLFNLIGTTYGGNGVDTFAVPNLNGEGSANPFGTGKGRYYVAVNGIFPDSSTDTYEIIYPYMGEIRLFLHSATTPVPMDWSVCNGDILSAATDSALCSLIGNYYGGDYPEFALPDLRGLEPVPGSRYCICTAGNYPDSASDGKDQNALPKLYTGEIRLFAISASITQRTPPAGWLRCNGQSLSNTDYPRLFSLLGTMYGGSGTVFNLPRLDGGSNPANPWNETNLGTYCIVADEQYAIHPGP